MPATRILRVLALMAAASAQAALATVTVSGSISFAGGGSLLYQITFSCTNTPTCSGVQTVFERDQACANSVQSTQPFTATGLDLSRAGTVQGTMTVFAIDHSSLPNASGICTYGSFISLPGTYTGTWDGARGTITLTVVNPDGSSTALPGTFTATGLAPPPVFPLDVTASITPTTASATAVVQPRSQDVGVVTSIFVFAEAPASIVRGAKVARGPGVAALATDGPDPCVRAQVGADGRLDAVDNSAMAPAVTGTLSAQGRSVGLLDKQPTANFTGTTFYVGYGPNSSAMLGNGVYEGALTIPGPTQCGTDLAASAVPKAPGPLTGLWWNSAESGWGIHFTQRGNVVFGAWFTYDDTGNPKWYVATNCPLPAGATGASGTCNGPLYAVSASAFFGATFNPATVSASSTGTLQVAFRDANNATMTYTLGSQTRTIVLARQIFQNGTTPPAVEFTDLWWNPKESGWGLGISHEFGVMFLAWYVYDGAGKPVWYVATNCVVSGYGCAGALYRVTGPPFGPSFDPARVHATPSGDVTVRFTDPNNGTLTYTVDGVTATKPIARQVF